MPLYMDFHIIPDVTIEDVKNAHIADQAVQDKFDVKYHQFWVNEAAGTVFCLMEGPDKESCAATHREAHGNVACEIVEVEAGMYSVFMGKNPKTDHGVVLHEDGSVDSGYRFVMVVNIIGNTHITSSLDYKNLYLPDKPKLFTISKIDKFQGKHVRHKGDDSIIAAFKTPEHAIGCAIEVRNKLLKKYNDLENSAWNVTFKIGIGCSPPLNENSGFFEEAIKLGTRLSLIAGNKEILVSSLVNQLSDGQIFTDNLHCYRTMGPSEEKFLSNLFDITEDKLSNERFTVQSLGNDIGLSRPQLYRKVKSITGTTPNNFIRGLKMHRAFSLIKQKQLNVSEVALEVGYSNPSYFAKCFYKTFGISPSKIGS
ncbi:DUF4242 domain-containing protein [Flavobacteriaceae bacterium F89]|uniref:DUF4242 domain-containing protein n=1 Tax=Cerina litoralis TaxID=2874477 RepID=A0AAE3ESP2_9FLAO|nr:nickel-binding protein [Cerina litoralis]MCG2459790.1 DUF4242 domain-containing protein [Cerina litoralis]